MKRKIKIVLALVAAALMWMAARPADACPGAKQGEANKMKSKGKDKSPVAKGKTRQPPPDKNRKI